MISELALLLAATGLASTSNAGSVTLGLILNPAAAGCTGCTLSGANTWELVAQASQGDNFGISAFSVPVLNVLTAFNRSPRVVVNPDDTADRAGFTLGRSANNQVVIPNGFLIGGAQDNATPTPFLIRGYGQETSSFAAKLPVGSDLGAPSTQTDWKSMLVLAEGTNAAGATPTVDFSSVDIGVNVFTAASGVVTAHAATSCLVASGCDFDLPPTIADGVINNVIAGDPDPTKNPVKFTFTATGTAPITWSGFGFDSFTQSFGGPASASPPIAATFDPNTQMFGWQTNGSPRGTYKWHVVATNGSASDLGFLTVNVVGVPEPASIWLAGIAVLSAVCFGRTTSYPRSSDLTRPQPMATKTNSSHIFLLKLCHRFC